MINEKAMFTTISWKQLLLGQRKIVFPFLGNKKTNDSEFTECKQESSDSQLSESFAESFATLDEVKELSARIIDAVNESAERNLSQQEFKNFLKLILAEYPYVKISSLRGTVNELIVSESQKNRSLAIALEQANDLWDETV